jgi:hypothetical protein
MAQPDQTLRQVADGHITQRFVAIALRAPASRWDAPGYETAKAIRSLVIEGLVERPPRFAELLHRRCSAKLTLAGRRELAARGPKVPRG